MLFFELFPFFMTLVALAAGIWLLIANWRAQREASDDRGSSHSETNAPVNRTDATK